MAEPVSPWIARLAAATGRVVAPVLLDIHHGPAGSGSSEPQEMTGPDNAHHAVKFVNNPQQPRVLVNEEVVGRVAALIDAPCPPVDVVTVPQDIADTIRFKSGATAVGGLAHGSRWLDSIRPGVSMQDALAKGDNLSRYSRLMVLITIVVNTDEQYVQDTDPPHRLWCVDFGHSLTGGPTWTADGLRQRPVPTSIEMRGPLPDDQTLRDVARQLRTVTDDDLADCVAPIPDDWGISQDERVAILEFLRARIDAVIAILPGEAADAA